MIASSNRKVFAVFAMGAVFSVLALKLLSELALAETLPAQDQAPSPARKLGTYLVADARAVETSGIPEGSICQTYHSKDGITAYPPNPECGKLVQVFLNGEGTQLILLDAKPSGPNTYPSALFDQELLGKSECLYSKNFSPAEIQAQVQDEAYAQAWIQTTMATQLFQSPICRAERIKEPEPENGKREKPRKARHAVAPTPPKTVFVFPYSAEGSPPGSFQRAAGGVAKRLVGEGLDYTISFDSGDAPPKQILVREHRVSMVLFFYDNSYTDYVLIRQEE